MSQLGATFIFPPFVEFALNGPHLAAPLLAAVCTREGLRTRQLDLNIRFARFLLEDYVSGSGLLDTPVASSPRAPQMADRSSAIKNPRAARFILKHYRESLFPTPRTLEDIANYNFELERPIAQELYNKDVGCVDARDTICITVAFAEQLVEALHIATIIRRRSPLQRIILGGSQINLLPEHLLTTIADLGIFTVIGIGNGENTVSKLIQGHDVTPTEKTILVKSGSISKQTLDELPLPHFVDLHLYFKPLTIPILVTKGCFWGECTFCDYVKLSDLGGLRYVARSPQRVLAEIAHMSDAADVSKFILISDAVPPSWFKRLCELALSNRIKINSWSYLLHHKMLDGFFFELIKSSGAQAVNFGTESFSDTVLEVMKKQASAAVAKTNIMQAHQAGLTSVVNIIPDYPTSNFNDAVKTYDTLYELRMNIDVINPQPFDLTDNTDVANNPERYGLKTITGAYERSSHGYHSINYERKVGLSLVERRAAIDMIGRLALRQRTERRNGFRDIAELPDTSCLVLDTSYYLANSVLNIASLGTSVRVNDATRSILADLPAAVGQGAKAKKIDWLNWLASAGDHRLATSPEALLSWLFETGLTFCVDTNSLPSEYP